MGQIADDMVEGSCCSWCGVYFVKDHGHPVLCNTCWKDSKPSERAGIPKAYHKEL